MEQYNLNSWHAFASMFVFWWQLSSALLLYMYFYLAVNYVVTVFETHFKKNRQDKNIEYQNKKISLYIYLPSEDQLISHKHVLYNIKAFWIYKFFVPQECFTFFILLSFDLHTLDMVMFIFKKNDFLLSLILYFWCMYTFECTFEYIFEYTWRNVTVFELQAYNSLHTKNT